LHRQNAIEGILNTQHYKIVYCTPALYSAGGVERVISVKANYFADVLGYDVTVIVTEGPDDTTFFPLSENVCLVNLHLDYEELWQRPFLTKVFLYLKKQYQYKRLLRSELLRLRPDFTISTLRREINFINDIDDGSIKLGELHQSLTNFRGIRSARPSLLERWFHAWWKKNLIPHLKRLGKLVVLTEKTQQEWAELNATTIPDPLTFDVDGPASSLTSKRIVAIGRYVNEKGYDLLLQAWAQVERQYPDWRLDLYGDGCRAPYEQLVETLHLDKTRCGLHGSLSDVMSVYLDSSLLVMPSRTEGFGLVLLEAMSCGLPVVAFDCENGPATIISDGVDGVLVPPFDVEAFARQMMLLMDDEDRRRQMGQNGREKARQYSIDKVGAQWQQLFEALKPL